MNTFSLLSTVPHIRVIKTLKDYLKDCRVSWLVSTEVPKGNTKYPTNCALMSSKFYKRSYLNLSWPFSLQPASQQTCEFYAALPPSLPALLSGRGQTGSHWGHDWHVLLGHSLQVQPVVCKIPGGRESQKNRAGGQRQCPVGAEGTGSIWGAGGEKDWREQIVKNAALIILEF